MYKLKSTSEDFKVTEQIKLHLDENGQYAYFWLNKRDYTTMQAMQKIASFIHCTLRDIGFAGNKDKAAVTKQAISIKDPSNRIRATRFDSFNSIDIKLEYIGRGKAQISLGDLDENNFEIIARDCDKSPAEITQFINYFDDQRFSETNKDVGRCILKGDFKQACSLIKSEEVERHLKEKPNDFVGAMKELPLKIRIMHIHSYQSYLWNETVKRYLQCKYNEYLKASYSLGELVFPKIAVEAKSVPIIGFGGDYDNSEFFPIIKELMREEALVERDFVIRAMPELSAEGGKREMTTEVKDLKIEKKDEKTYKLTFTLAKGCYATMAVKRMMA